MKTYKEFRESQSSQEEIIIENALRAISAAKPVVQDDPHTESVCDECIQALTQFKNMMSIRFNPKASNFTDFNTI